MSEDHVHVAGALFLWVDAGGNKVHCLLREPALAASSPAYLNMNPNQTHILTPTHMRSWWADGTLTTGPRSAVRSALTAGELRQLPAGELRQLPAGGGHWGRGPASAAA